MHLVKVRSDSKLGCVKLQGIGRDLERLHTLYFEIRVII